MIADYLGYGEATARPGREISILLNLSMRELTQAVEKERREGQPICASTGKNPGYYLAANQKEMQRYCDSLQRRTKEIEKTRKACIATMDALPQEG